MEHWEEVPEVSVPDLLCSDQTSHMTSLVVEQKASDTETAIVARKVGSEHAVNVVAVAGTAESSNLHLEVPNFRRVGVPVEVPIGFGNPG